VKKAAGGDDISHFDRLKVRVMLKLRLGYTLGIPKTFNKNEKDFLVKYYGYKDGPVRSLRVMKNNIQLIWKLPSPGATVNSVFYPDWIEWPVPINLPVRPGWLFSRQELDVSHDFNFPPDKGVKLFVSSHPDKWYEVTSKTSPEMMALNKETTEGGYYGIDATSIGAGGWFYTVRRPKSFDTKLGGVFRSDASESGEPEYYGDENNEPERGWIKGSTPLAGGRFVDWNDVGRGIHTVNFYHIYPPNYARRRRRMSILDRPVESLSTVVVTRGRAFRARPRDFPAASGHGVRIGQDAQAREAASRVAGFSPRHPGGGGPLHRPARAGARGRAGGDLLRDPRRDRARHRRRRDPLVPPLQRGGYCPGEARAGLRRLARGVFSAGRSGSAATGAGGAGGADREGAGHRQVAKEFPGTRQAAMANYLAGNAAPSGGSPERAVPLVLAALQGLDVEDPARPFAQGALAGALEDQGQAEALQA
jgi:hypothetical protein